MPMCRGVAQSSALASAERSLRVRLTVAAAGACVAVSTERTRTLACRVENNENGACQLDVLRRRRVGTDRTVVK